MEINENFHDIVLETLQGPPIDPDHPEVKHGYAIYPQGAGNWYMALPNYWIRCHDANPMAARSIDTKARWIDPVGLKEFKPGDWWKYRLFTFNNTQEDGKRALKFGTMHQCPNAMDTVINLIKAFKLSEAILNHKGQHEAYITPRLIIAVLDSCATSMMEAFKDHDETCKLECANPSDHPKWDVFTGDWTMISQSPALALSTANQRIKVFLLNLDELPQVSQMNLHEALYTCLVWYNLGDLTRGMAHLSKKDFKESTRPQAR